MHLNKFGWTPLHAAAYKGNTALVKYFLMKGADENIRNFSGKSPKMLAQDAGHHEVLETMRHNRGTRAQIDLGSSTVIAGAA